MPSHIVQPRGATRSGVGRVLLVILANLATSSPVDDTAICLNSVSVEDRPTSANETRGASALKPPVVPFGTLPTKFLISTVASPYPKCMEPGSNSIGLDRTPSGYSQPYSLVDQKSKPVRSQDCGCSQSEPRPSRPLLRTEVVTVGQPPVDHRRPNRLRGTPTNKTHAHPRNGRSG
jgi:hypothetical protein